MCVRLRQRIFHPACLTSRQPCRGLGSIPRKQAVFRSVQNQGRQPVGTLHGRQVRVSDTGTARSDTGRPYMLAVEQPEGQGDRPAVRMAGHVHPLLIDAPAFTDPPRDTPQLSNDGKRQPLRIGIRDDEAGRGRLERQAGQPFGPKSIRARGRVHHQQRMQDRRIVVGRRAYGIRNAVFGSLVVTRPGQPIPLTRRTGVGVHVGGVGWIGIGAECRL